MMFARKDGNGTVADEGRGAWALPGRAPVALALVATLAACGGGSGGGTPSSSPDVTEAPGNQGGPGGTGGTNGDPGTGGGDPGTGASGPGGPEAASMLRPDQITNVDADGSTTVVVESYDDTGLIRIEEYFTDGTIVRTSRFEYDAASRIATRVDFVDDTDEVLATTSYDYTADGVQSGRDILDADGNLLERLSYDFGGDGLVEAANLVRLAFEDGTPLPDGGQLVERTTYEYANGRLSRELISSDPEDAAVTATRDYSYAADGTLDIVTDNDASAGATSVATWRYEAGPCTLAWANSLFAHFCVATGE